jgi:hypothetical protein
LTGSLTAKARLPPQVDRTVRSSTRCKSVTLLRQTMLRRNAAATAGMATADSLQVPVTVMLMGTARACGDADGDVDGDVLAEGLDDGVAGAGDAAAGEGDVEVDGAIDAAAVGDTDRDDDATAEGEGDRDDEARVVVLDKVADAETVCVAMAVGDPEGEGVVALAGAVDKCVAELVADGDGDGVATALDVVAVDAMGELEGEAVAEAEAVLIAVAMAVTDGELLPDAMAVGEGDRDADGDGELPDDSVLTYTAPVDELRPGAPTTTTVPSLFRAIPPPKLSMLATSLTTSITSAADGDQPPAGIVYMYAAPVLELRPGAPAAITLPSSVVATLSPK